MLIIFHNIALAFKELLSSVLVPNEITAFLVAFIAICFFIGFFAPKKP